VSRSASPCLDLPYSWPSFCLLDNRLARRRSVHCAMDGEAKIMEVSFFGGKILVTFADGMMAMLEPGQIRQLAVESNALTPLPTDDIPS
jgi:hypothetical protein